MAIKKQHSGPRAGEDRMAFLERRLTRRTALKYGAAGGAAAVATLYASPLIQTVRANGDVVTPVPDGACETAWALGGWCFLFNLISAEENNRWGWSIEVGTVGTPTVIAQIPVIGGNGNNCAPIGSLVGHIDVDYDPASDMLHITFFPEAGFDLSDFHLWVGNVQLPGGADTEDDAAPGAFPFQNEDGNFWISVLGLGLVAGQPLWISYHSGEACGVVDVD